LANNIGHLLSLSSLNSHIDQYSKANNNGGPIYQLVSS